VLNLQTDVVINLDLPWNPARLEQRIARVHRIGSKRTVQELLLVTKDSIEQRILQLHDTKRDVLANTWDKGNEDTIAAPGGSGAFREMVTSLLTTGHAPSPVSASAPATTVDSPVDSVASSMGTAAESSGLGDASSPVSAAISFGPPTSVPREPQSISNLVVDPNALMAAISAIAPALPPDHRRSLATVLRVLAEGLESA